MPKAIRFNQLGGTEVFHFEDVPELQPGPGEVWLKLEAVGLNQAESIPIEERHDAIDEGLGD